MSTRTLLRVLEVLVTIAICNVSVGCVVNHGVITRSGALMRGQQDSGSSVSVGATVLPKRNQAQQPRLKNRFHQELPKLEPGPPVISPRLRSSSIG